MTSAGSEGEGRTRLETIEAPYGREIRIDEVRFESGMNLMRLTIREGRRFTILDIDADTANKWAKVMSGWAAASRGEKPDG